jgi:hypothetical protein
MNSTSRWPAGAAIRLHMVMNVARDFGRDARDIDSAANDEDNEITKFLFGLVRTTARPMLSVATTADEVQAAS